MSQTNRREGLISKPSEQVWRAVTDRATPVERRFPQRLRAARRPRFHVPRAAGLKVGFDLVPSLSLGDFGYGEAIPIYDFFERTGIIRVNPHTQPHQQRTQMTNTETKTESSPEQRAELFKILGARFEKNMNLHPGLEWGKVKARLEANAGKLWSLHEMEKSGGEPDVVGHDQETGEYIFFDCSAESPKGRTCVCYDRAGLDSRKEHKPTNNAVDMAAALGIELLTEEQYRELQQLGNFDTKTSSWVKAPADIRKLGGALYCERRYGRVFVGHNGAQSYYSGRAFRGSLRI